jgi:hypothetical protein
MFVEIVDIINNNSSRYEENIDSKTLNDAISRFDPSKTQSVLVSITNQTELNNFMTCGYSYNIANKSISQKEPMIFRMQVLMYCLLIIIMMN